VKEKNNFIILNYITILMCDDTKILIDNIELLVVKFKTSMNDIPTDESATTNLNNKPVTNESLIISLNDEPITSLPNESLILSLNNEIKNMELLIELVDDKYYLTYCPWCNIYTKIKKKRLNCTIFRCGAMKSDGQPIPPHLPKDQCDKLVEDNLIYGCSKPFKFDGNTIETCGYI
jgi:hypothetical protein